MEPTLIDPRETEDVLNRIRAGDSRALEELFTRHRDVIRQVVERRFDHKLRQRVDPSDVVQETLIQAARRLVAYLDCPRMPFCSWLRKIACDCLLMTRRKHLEAERRALAKEVSIRDESTVRTDRQLITDGSTPVEHLIGAELGSGLRKAIGRLPESDREILLMRDFDGLSNQETAQILGIKPSAANKRYGRALLRLRSLLLRAGQTESAHAR